MVQAIHNELGVRKYHCEGVCPNIPINLQAEVSRDRIACELLFVHEHPEFDQRSFETTESEPLPFMKSRQRRKSHSK